MTRDMRKSMISLTVVLLPLLSACGGKTPVGTWELDTEAVAKQLEAVFDKQYAEMPAEQQQMAKSMMKPMLDQFRQTTSTMEIEADGTYTTTSQTAEGEPQVESGTWTLEGDQITLEKSDSDQSITGTFAGNEMRLTQKGGPIEFEAVLTRK